VKVVAFLQNAWSPVYAGGAWPRESWLRALWASRSGQRLRVFTKHAGPAVEVWWDNTTPQVSARPADALPPDHAHMAEVLGEQNPDALVLFGAQAAAAVRAPALPTLVLPHPAYRVVTNALYRRAGLALRRGFAGRVEYRQVRGEVRRVKVPV
jgi:hypothetical protein